MDRFWLFKNKSYLCNPNEKTTGLINGKVLKDKRK